MAKNSKKDDLSLKFKVNDEIKYRGNVRIVGEGIESRIVDFSEAKKIANDNEMDLVEIQTKSEIPIIKICNYEKMLYKLKKEMKAMKQKNKAKPLKDIQLSVNIAKHDLETKANSAKKFIEEGCKVRVILTMKGRELSRREENKKSILEFIVMMEEVAKMESQPRDEGNKTVVILKPRK
jgi:translation initiation factor IF-3